MKICLRSLMVMMLAFLSVSCVSAQDSSLAPDFKLEDTGGNTITLSAYKNKPVILFFWTTWCPHCRRELSILNDMHADFEKDGAVLLTIDVGESLPVVENFIRKQNLFFTVLLDRNSNTAHAYRVSGVPTYILVDREGKIHSRKNYFPQKEYRDLISK